MKREKTKKIDITSNSGFTIADLAIALIMFTVFVGTIGSLFYETYKLNLQTRQSALATNYAIQILEDIDKISYEEVINGLESEYMTKFSIPSRYKLSIIVSDYKENENTKDFIKIVDFKISYTLAGNTENITIKKIKVKEI